MSFELSRSEFFSIYHFITFPIILYCVKRILRSILSILYVANWTELNWTEYNVPFYTIFNALQLNITELNIMSHFDRKNTRHQLTRTELNIMSFNWNFICSERSMHLWSCGRASNFLLEGRWFESARCHLFYIILLTI